MLVCAPTGTRNDEFGIRKINKKGRAKINKHKYRKVNRLPILAKILSRLAESEGGTDEQHHRHHSSEGPRVMSTERHCQTTMCASRNTRQYYTEERGYTRLLYRIAFGNPPFWCDLVWCFEAILKFMISFFLRRKLGLAQTFGV